MLKTLANDAKQGLSDINELNKTVENEKKVMEKFGAFIQLHVDIKQLSLKTKFFIPL